MFRYFMPVLSLLLVLAAAAHANGLDGCYSDWGWSDVHCPTPRIAICPQGDFEPIREGCGGDDDYIWVQVLDNCGYPIPGIPYTDYWLQACDPAEELCLCANPMVADSVTNAEGRTTISGHIHGGGCALNGLYLVVQWKILISMPSGCVDITCRDITIVSVDLNADCRVNLSDLAAFGLSYNKWSGEPGFNTCCDFNDDIVCNLSDFAFMGAHYLHECD